MTKTVATVRPFSGAKYEQNSERAGDLFPCAICGNGCKNWIGAVHVVAGGARFATKEEHEGTIPVDSAADMGCFPVGPECARKIKAAGAFVFPWEG